MEEEIIEEEEIYEEETEENEEEKDLEIAEKVLKADSSFEDGRKALKLEFSRYGNFAYDTATKRSKNRMYFDEEETKAWILEYQKTAKRDSEGKLVWVDKELESKIMYALSKITYAIINKYHYNIYESTSDLLQEGLMACFNNILKFSDHYVVGTDENQKIKYATVFNYFSLINKYCLFQYTFKRKKHRDCENTDDQQDLHKSYQSNDIFYSDFETTLNRHINEDFIGQKRRDYIFASKVLVEYFNLTKGFISKLDLNSFMRGYNISQKQAKEFFKAIEPYKTEIYSLLK